MFPLESMGETGENVAERWGVSREEQDAFALAIQRRWAAAAEAGRFDDELVAVDGRRRATSIRAPTRRREARGARARVSRGRHRHGRELSGINDGAAALVIASEERARELGAEAARALRRRAPSPASTRG